MPKGHAGLQLEVPLGPLLVVKALDLLDCHVGIVYNALGLAEGLVIGVDLRKKLLHQRTSLFVDLDILGTHTKMERLVALLRLGK